ncbi:hypothetical protein [Streptomyces coerulescens]|uniref:Uncharacterized protein n=1 Tax=Streptomyces coerulescens TaxID=29304 RepID=A0ABW0CMG1_STRCD
MSPGSNAPHPRAPGAPPFGSRAARGVDAFNAHAGGPYFAAFCAEAGAYAEGPTWLMRGNVVADKPADLRS